MTTNLLLATDNTNHGSAFYMLTGTDDFEYLLDSMVSKEQITADEAKSILSAQDGYRLRFMMVGMKKLLDTENDTEAICLHSVKAGGALCAGLRYNGSSIVTYGSWIPGGAFAIAETSS